MIVGGLAAIGALIYFCVKAYQNSDKRTNLLKKRIIPSFIIMLICFGIAGTLSDHSKNSHHEAVSSSKTEHHKESSNDDDDDDSESEENDDESDNTDTSSDNQEDTEDTDNNSNATLSNNSNGTGVDNNHGDMTTDQQGTIVGNSKSMIYHTPGQHGYRMNSANAVYFKTEAEAQAAGYRKALR